MRVATFNLENLDLRPGEEAALDRRAETLRPKLERAAADILCLQEVNAQKALHHGTRTFAALERLLAGTRYASYLRAHTTHPKGGGPMDVHNLVLLSRYPIAESLQIHHHLVPTWHWTPPRRAPSVPVPVEIVWDRPALHVRIDLDGQRSLHVLNLHLRALRAAPLFDAMRRVDDRSVPIWAEGFFLAAQKQIGQALEVRLLIDRLFDADPLASILVCGDLNAEGHEIPLRLLCAASDDTGMPELGTRCLMPLEDRLPASVRYSVRHAGRPVMLDHLLASQSMAQRCTGVEVFNEDLVDEAYVLGRVTGSLHAPLVAEFR